jgi:hypothetical protein
MQFTSGIRSSIVSRFLFLQKRNSCDPMENRIAAITPLAIKHRENRCRSSAVGVPTKSHLLRVFLRKLVHKFYPGPIVSEQNALRSSANRLRCIECQPQSDGLQPAVACSKRIELHLDGGSLQIDGRSIAIDSNLTLKRLRNCPVLRTKKISSAMFGLETPFNNWRSLLQVHSIRCASWLILLNANEKFQ